MASSLTISSIPKVIEVLDRTFNFFGYIPIVSSISGQLRQHYGAIQIISSIAMAAIFLATGSHFAIPASALLVSGVFHIFRGTIELLPFFGNAACIIYDIARLTI